MKEKRPCEAPEHVPGCSGFGETRDHFTPRCIAKKLGWNPHQIGCRDNIQYLSVACHRAKDRTTPRRLEELDAQLSGENFGLGDHVKSK